MWFLSSLILMMETMTPRLQMSQAILKARTSSQELSNIDRGWRKLQSSRCSFSLQCGGIPVVAAMTSIRPS